MKPDVLSWREQEGARPRKPNRNKKIGAFAAAAEIGLTVVVQLRVGLERGQDVLLGAHLTTLPAR